MIPKKPICNKYIDFRRTHVIIRELSISNNGIKMRESIKKLQAIIEQAKPGENITQAEYDLMCKILKIARDMMRLRAGVQATTTVIIASVIAGFAVKYGYDYDLGTKIQSYTIPINAGLLGGEYLMVHKLRTKLAIAKDVVKKINEIYLSRTFR
ncbi:MAG: hypothetical protein IJ866_01380 [Alphaproteobacteria bacterium]|nr:hypothetical protein [Alphaproteobacteria bacterium]